MSIKNSKGKVYYGMHFYPGVAEYSEPGKDPYRVYLNEDTLRSMDPSFAGRPIFVEHVDEVEDDIDELRKDADGWVIESFYNAADGKHWVKFIVVSERGEKAVQRGMRLSNAYVPSGAREGGLWNGVSYTKEITGGEFEHLAIVRNPRYEESVIMTPEQFKQYNTDKELELTKLANSKDHKEKTKMKLNLFKRAKVENSADLESMSVVLPKSGKEMTITQLVNAADEAAEAEGKEQMANAEHMVELHDGTKMNVADLVAKHKAMSDELESMKKENKGESEGDLEVEEEPVDSESVDNEEPVEPAKDDKELEAAKKKNAADKKKSADELAAKRKEAKEKAERLKNAHLRDEDEETATVEFSQDQVARGKARYGSK